MNTTLLFDFSVDKPNKTVTIQREFAAELSLVWDAFTKAELLDQWTAPKPFAARTKHMNFEVGGRRFYAMVSPDGTERWAVQKYLSITPKTHFTMYNAFSDENENVESTGSEWDYTFRESESAEPMTTLTLIITNESQERFERMLEMGFVEGYKMTIAQLDELLASLSKLS